MVSTGTSSLPGGSLQLRASQSVFDITKESDVIALLRAVHQNPIEEELKNHIRDLIFSYRQAQNEVDLQELVLLFASLGIAVHTGNGVSEKSPATAGQTPQAKTAIFFGNSRPRPQFKRANVTVHTASVLSAKEPQVLPTVEAIPDVGVPSYKPQEVEPEVVTIPVDPLVTEKAPTPTHNTEPVAPVPKAVVQNTEGTQPTARIAEIKRIVNEKVGNPVNLIDANNEIGREYMNALLDAMKKTNGGQPQEVAAAMERLEHAFVAVQEIIQNGSTAAIKAKPVSVPQEAEKEEVEPMAVPPTREALKVAPESNPVHIKVQDTALEKTLSTSARKPLSERVPIQPSVSTGVPAMHSVAKEKQLQDLLRSNREQESIQAQQESVIEQQSADPLYAPEITAGLGQLLSEWSLFKSSGIFGTGPSGKDHVLFLKLAPLTMAAVIAGRFDGATTKIKQSIADYMNGWRYEEGILHEHSETFEHYLRRVIHHILSKRIVSK
jgi:hypothetical protein